VSSKPGAVQWPVHASSSSAVAVARCIESGSAAAMLTASCCCPDGASASTSLGPRSFVASERLGFEPSAVVAILEDMSYPNRGRDALDPALH
jgi:hypothetical protein